MAQNTARTLSLDEVRARVARLQAEGQKLVGQLRKDAQAIAERQPVVARAIEEGRKLQSTVRERAEQAVADIEARRTQVRDLIAAQIIRLGDLTVQRLRLVRQDELDELVHRVDDLEQKLADAQRKSKAA